MKDLPIKWICRIESANDATIKFSKFDSCYISGFELNDGTIFENKEYDRDISNFFQKVFNYIKKFDYE